MNYSLTFIDLDLKSRCCHFDFFGIMSITDINSIIAVIYVFLQVACVCFNSYVLIVMANIVRTVNLGISTVIPFVYWQVILLKNNLNLPLIVFLKVHLIAFINDS